ncbi:MAG: YbbR-like domain-containing protein [Acidobacteria bacterium]|nr:YbbR-like domain-containing protein [Acidobacteriota bacterium]
MENGKLNTTLKKNVKKLLKGLNPFHNFLLKIISLAIALVGLYFVAGQLLVEEYEIPLYLKIPNNLYPVEYLPDKVTVRILASSTILNTLDKNQIYFDFKNVDFQEGEVFLNLERYLKSPPGVEIGNIQPTKLHFILEQKITRDVPIDVNFTGKLPNGYDLLRYELHPTTVKIEGAKSVVNSIVKLETDLISLTNRKEPFSIDAPLQLENLNVRNVNKEPIILSTIIVKNAETRVLHNVPVQVISPPEQYQINPKSVNVTFLCAADYTGEITQEDISVAIDLTGYKLTMREFRADLKLEIIKQEINDKCRFQHFSQRKVDIYIKKFGNSNE